MAKKKTKGSSALKKITTRAKQIYKQGGTWATAIKKSGAEYRGKKRKVGGVKKRTVRKVHRKKVGAARPREVGKDRFDNKRVNITVGGVTTAETIHRSIVRAKNGILDKLMALEGKKFTAHKVSEKKKIEKRIAKLRIDYKRLSAIG